jgi:hypothetical protein
MMLPQESNFTIMAGNTFIAIVTCGLFRLSLKYLRINRISR